MNGPKMISLLMVEKRTYCRWCSGLVKHTRILMTGMMYSSRHQRGRDSYPMVNTMAMQR